MKVLDINNLYSPSGGGVRIYHHEKLKWCKANGIENLLLYPASENTTTRVNGGMVKGLKSPRLAGSGYNFFIRGKPIRQALMEFNPDVVELGSGIVLPSMVHGVLKNTLSFAYFHSNWPETLPMSVFGINDGMIPALFQKAATPFMRRAYTPLNAIMGGSDYSINALKKAGLTKLEKIPLGTYPDVFHPENRSEELRSVLDIPKNGKMILFMGRLASEKGIHVLLDASKYLFQQKGLVVVVVGSGQWENKVKHICSKNPTKIKHISHVASRLETARLIASADAFVAAGPLETFSLVTLEALSCSTPVAACSRGAAAELVTRAGGNSTYSPWNSGKALYDAILKALATTRDERDNFRNFAEKYTWDACFTKQFELYNSFKSL